MTRSSLLSSPASARDEVLLRSRNFVVTAATLRTPSAVFALEKIEHLRLRRPWLPAATTGGSSVALIATVFWPELLSHERALLVALAAAMWAVGLTLGRLELLSMALHRGEGVWGAYRELRLVRQGLEEALAGLRQTGGSGPAAPRTDNELA